MNSIYKFPLTIAADQSLFMNGDAQILDVQAQQGELCLWARVDHSKPTREYRVCIYGTGQPVPNELPHPHLATVQLNGLVWHVYGGEKA